jgi:hypothetical protein
MHLPKWLTKLLSAGVSGEKDVIQQLSQPYPEPSEVVADFSSDRLPVYRPDPVEP